MGNQEKYDLGYICATVVRALFVRGHEVGHQIAGWHDNYSANWELCR